MLTLLHPSALLALLGLSVPVAIHLWNRRPGREVAVGSLRWLAAGANSRLRNLKPEQLWLLLLRAALLAALAAAVAGPVWRQVQPTSRGVVLMSPEVLGAPGLATLRPTIDSLRRRGYALRWLAADFPRISNAAWRADSVGRRDSARLFSATSQWADNFRWARVQQASSAFSGQPLYVVTAATQRHFQGLHPAPGAAITWQTLPVAATETWVQTAALTGDSLRLLLGQSTENRTTFRTMAMARPRPGALLRMAAIPPLRFQNRAGKSWLEPLPAASGLGQSTAPPVPVRTQPLRITIYSTAEYSPDARFLQTGLRAAAIGLPVPLALHLTTAPPSPTTAPDWLFWLSDAPLPTVWCEAVRHGTHIWQEAARPGRADSTTLVINTPGEASAAVFRLGTAQVDSSTIADRVPVWSDGQGRALLTRQTLGQGAFYRLQTRLNPAWSELADSPTLPAQLLDLLQPGLSGETMSPDSVFKQSLAAHDQRALDPAQFSTNPKPTTARKAPTAGMPGKTFRDTDLRPWLVLAAGLLFALERLLARRREAQSFTTITP